MEDTTTMPVVQTLEIPASVKQLVEALIFAAGEPLSAKQIKEIYESSSREGEERRIEGDEVDQIVNELNDEFQQSAKAYRIIRIGGGYQFATLAEYAEWIGKLNKEQGRRKLSQSSLESLSIIAYRQPISKPEIEAIRGVNCDYVLKTLLEKDLVTIVGRAPTPGRPLLYGTTKQFLMHFGLNDIADLPKPREIEELLGDSRYETERRMMEAQEQAAAETAKKEEEEFKSRLPHIPKKKPELDGDVTIVPRKRSRAINVRQKDGEETSGQEQLPLSESPVEHPTSAGIDLEERASPVPPTESSENPPYVRLIPESIEVGKEPELDERADEEVVEALSQSTESLKETAAEIVEEGEGDSVIETQAIAGTDQALDQPETPTSVLEEEKPQMHDVALIGGPRNDALLLGSFPAVESEGESQQSSAPEETPRVEPVMESSEPQSVVGVPRDETHTSAPLAPTSTADITLATVTEDSLPTKQRSRWQTWKEKIQGFIKKVFG
jgi:segregation and condensation protein B